MAIFRMILGIFLVLMAPALIYIGLDAQESGIDLGEPNGTRGAALFDLVGMWGMALISFGVGISEILTGKKLLQEGNDDK
ncbi:hypothetical protein C8N29_106124 [Agitococcus lubricus]|uniref:Uncharacterized protein n=2 Tax=Agitococcus lubricus TaxID=1077255 RepID=A0A2T5IZY1_9GAMM|nr:hypothetical protein C8N29_106124 [Agitococcus lubricus]